MEENELNPICPEDGTVMVPTGETLVYRCPVCGKDKNFSVMLVEIVKQRDIRSDTKMVRPNDNTFRL